MKKRLCAAVMVLIALLSLSVPALAAETASDQIMRYYIDASRGVGRLEMEFDITGTDTMDKIGCQSIYIWAKNGTSWSYVDCLLEDDPGMSETDTFGFGNVIYYDSEDGVEYKVVITIFAENSAGRDTRTEVVLLP